MAESAQRSVDVAPYLRAARAAGLPERIARWAAGRHATVSDLRDRDGHQYVDLVMEGGGVLGVALVGYTWALEEAGIRFLGLGGTSAGAVNAVLLAAAGAAPGEARSLRVLERVGALSLESLVDGGSSALQFLRSAFGRRTRPPTACLVAQGLRPALRVLRRLGLNPGAAFEGWVLGILEEWGAATWGALEARLEGYGALVESRARPEGTRGRVLATPAASAAQGCLAVVASDVATETRVVFPRMAPLYFEDARAASPARFVRASMSVPLFFEPVAWDLPRGPSLADWRAVGWFGAEPPRHAVLCDGGLLSNFPIDVFHEPGTPTAPTFGVRLGSDLATAHRVASLADLLAAAVDTMRHDRDDAFLAEHPDYSALIRRVDTGDHFWLDFSLGEEAKADLFLRGATAAVEFLETFRWEEYQADRRAMAPVAARRRAARRTVAAPGSRPGSRWGA